MAFDECNIPNCLKIQWGHLDENDRPLPGDHVVFRFARSCKVRFLGQKEA